MSHNILRVMACTGLLFGCASAPLPNRSVESTTATIRAAEGMGAGRTPQGAAHLQLAREASERARILFNEGHQERAAYLLMRADADAEVAVALSRQQAVETGLNPAAR